MQVGGRPPQVAHFRLTANETWGEEANGICRAANFAFMFFGVMHNAQNFSFTFHFKFFFPAVRVKIC